MKPNFVKQGLINENLFAKAISDMEGKKEEVNIAQIKEVQKCLLDLLAKCTFPEVANLLHRHRKG